MFLINEQLSKSQRNYLTYMFHATAPWLQLIAAFNLFKDPELHVGFF